MQTFILQICAVRPTRNVTPRPTMLPKFFPNLSERIETSRNEEGTRCTSCCQLAWIDQNSLERLLDRLEVRIQEIWCLNIWGAQMLSIAAINIFCICCEGGSNRLLPHCLWHIGLHYATPRQRQRTGHLQATTLSELNNVSAAVWPCLHLLQGLWQQAAAILPLAHRVWFFNPKTKANALTPKGKHTQSVDQCKCSCLTLSASVASIVATGCCNTASGT